MAERAEEGMDNENVCGAENSSPSPPLVDAATLDERDEGTQKYMNGDDAAPERKTEVLLSSFRQKDEADNAVELKDGFASPLGHTSTLLPPLNEQEASSPIQAASEERGSFDSKHAAEDAVANMELSSEESRQGEAPVEIDLEPGKKASADTEHELNIELVEVQSTALNPLESEPGQQYLVQSELDNTAESEGGACDNSGPGDYIINKPQEQLVNDTPGISSMAGESQEAGDVQQGGAPEQVEKDTVVFGVNQERAEEQIQDHSASAEFNEQEDLETADGNDSDEPPAAATVPDEALLLKYPSLSTPAMEALIDVHNVEPSHGQEDFGTVEEPEQHLEAKETHEESATGSDRQVALEWISNQVEVDNNAQEGSENSAFGEDDDSPESAAESTKEVIISNGQELGSDTSPDDEQDGKETLGNEPPFVFEQENEKFPIDEVPTIMELCVEQEPDIEEPYTVEQEPLEQNLDTVPSSSDLEMAADINEKGDEAQPLKADEDTTSTGISKGEAFEVVGRAASAHRLQESNSENEPGLQAWNGKQAPSNPYNKESDETFNKQLETEGLFAGQAKSSIQISNEAFPSEGETEAKSKIEAANGQLDGDDHNKKVQDEQVSVNKNPCSNTSMEANHLIENCDKSSSNSQPASEREHKGQGIGSTTTVIQLETTADGISNGVVETSVTAEAPNKNHLSEHVLEHGDSLQRHPSRENGGEVEVSYVGHSTPPVLELGKVINGMSAEDGKQSTLEPLIYNNSVSEDKSSEVWEVGTQATEIKGRDIDAGKGKEILGVTKGVPSLTGVLSTSDSLDIEDGFLKPSEGDFEKEYKAKAYTNGTTNICIAEENAEVFHCEKSREASLSLVVPEKRDMAPEHVEQKGTEHTNGRGTLARRTNWWGCCGMLDLLLQKDE